MPNLSTLEISEIRGFFSKAFERMVTLDSDAEKHSEAENDWLKEQERASYGGGRGREESAGGDDDWDMN